jgi:hypothetical protein
MLISATSLIKESWKIYKDNFLLFLKIVVWLFIPSLIWTILDVLNITRVVAVPINICIWVAYFILGLFISVALVLIVNDLEKEKEIDLKNIYNQTYPKVFSFLWVSIIVNFLTTLGIVFLVVPGIIFSVLFSFAPIASVLDGKEGFVALHYSKGMVKDNFWAVLWRWIAPYFVFVFALCVTVLILLYAVSFATGEPVATLSGVSPWWASLISDALSILAIPLFTIIGVLFYNNLKKEKGEK